jgi:hypothetical protein
MVFIGCFGAAMFVAGMIVGEKAPVKTLPADCPVVKGEKVISTSVSKDGQFCNYIRTKGHAVYGRKV